MSPTLASCHFKNKYPKEHTGLCISFGPVQNGLEWFLKPSTVVIFYFDIRKQLIGKILVHF